MSTDLPMPSRELDESPRDHPDGRRTPGAGAHRWGLLDAVLAVAGGFLLGLLVTAAVVAAFRVGGVRLGNAPALALLGVSAGLGIYGGVWLLILRRRGASWSDLGFRAVPARVLLAVVGVLGGLVLATWAIALVTVLLFGQLQNPQIESIAPGGGIGLADYLWLLLAVSVTAPLAEELVFRGLLYPYLRRRMRPVVAGVLSAAVFAVAHGYGTIFVPLFVAGLVFAWLRERYDSLWPPILLHGLFNGLQVTLLYVALNALP